ncbi:MAG: DUF11 domain-containing protein [Bryobacteraceae bacterium]
MRRHFVILTLLIPTAAHPAVAQSDRVSPVLEYVLEAGPNLYDAWFGYLNNNPGPVTIPVGSANRFTGTQDRGQPSLFQPGRQVRVFSVRFDGNPLVWTLTGPDGNTRTSTASKAALVTPGSADLNLTATGSQGPAGETTVVFTVRNDGPYPAKDAKVEISIPGGYQLLRASADPGATPRNSTNKQWDIASLAYGASLSIRVTVTGDRTQGNVEVRASCQHQGPDPDPSDNHAAYTITGQSGSASDGGLESNGRLTLLLARRWALREQAPRTKTRIRLAEGRPTTEIDALLPESGPAETRAVPSGPADLIGVTNAAAVSGVDYVDGLGVRKGAILAIATDAGVYEHSKAVCDRLAGAHLEQIREFSAGSVPFLMAKLKQPDGSVEYSVSFAVSPASVPWQVDSRWNPAVSARFPRQRVLNFQVWASNADFTEQLLRSLLARMPRVVSEDASLSPPSVFARSVRYRAGTIRLELVRLDPALKTLDVQGSLASTETGERTWVTHSIPLADQVAIPTGPLFDFNFRLGDDVLYAADGAWSYWDSPGDGRVTEFTVEPEGSLADPDTLPVERPIRARGMVTTYVSFFRHLLPKALPADLSEFGSIEFTASGSGTLEFIPVKASVRTPSAQVRQRIELTGDAQRYRMEFESLGENFKANDITTFYFNLLGDGAESRAFDVRIEGIRLNRR